MKNSNAADIRDFVIKLGMEPEIAEIYTALYAHGPQHIAELARTSGVERTRIYRLLDRLADSHVIEIETHYKRSIYKAAPISNLRILLSKKEQELKSLEVELASLEDSFTQNSLSSPATRVQFYRGPDGVKQMFWNGTKAKTHVMALLYENMQSKTNSIFFERWAERCNELKIQNYGIFGKEFVASQQEWYSKHSNERLQYWQPRLAPEHFSIKHSMVIYNNVVSYYNWKDGEVFGIEVYNQEIANTQRQFFAMLWQQSTPFDDVKGIPKENTRR